MKKNKPGISKSTGKGFSPFKENKSDARKTDSARPFAKFEKKPKEQFRDNDSDDASDKKPFRGDRKPFEKKASGDRKPFDKKPFGDRDKKPFDKSRKSFGDDDKPRRSFGDRDKKPFDKDRKPFGDRDKKPFDGERKSFGDREKKPFDGERKSFGDREKKPFDGERKSFGDREKKPFDGERKSFGDREKKPFDGERKSFGDREKKPFDKDRKSFGDKDKKSFSKDKDARKGRKGADDKPKSFFDGIDIWASDKPKRDDLREDLPDFSKTIDDNWTDDAPYGKEGEKAEKGRRPEGKETRGTISRRKKTEDDRKPGRKRIEVRDKNAPKESSDEMPLNKYLAHSGLCSRRKAVDYIKDGKVTVNGVQVLEPATKVTPRDLVKLNEKKLTISKNLVYVLLNKPKGYITTTDDPEGRQTVMELVADATDERVFPVGRLDRNTSGLLLLTNDGDLAQKLAHPKHNIKKIYHVGLDKPLTKADFEKILQGVELEDGVANVDALGYVDNKDKSQIGIEIHSGKNRIVRRIFEHLEYKVEKLDRVMYAGLTKKNINRGKWRFLTEKEVILLKHFK
ncbi:pseudouridine synthase [Chitinophaga horti]|uniref:Pseudouridine synthase n=1 Tax=Chitinophaga horti TaxID=2920382 RepID=A0ABY6IY08_9BACT|nr:pseudouridine synthase [Chitinophaga horti]UYQ92268.1 pseudouridine synthase [Chitinophaga horti]